MTPSVNGRRQQWRSSCLNIWDCVRSLVALGTPVVLGDLVYAIHLGTRHHRDKPVVVHLLFVKVDLPVHARIRDLIALRHVGGLFCM